MFTIRHTWRILGKPQIRLQRGNPRLRLVAQFTFPGSRIRLIKLYSRTQLLALKSTELAKRYFVESVPCVGFGVPCCIGESGLWWLRLQKALNSDVLSGSRHANSETSCSVYGSWSLLRQVKNSGAFETPSVK